MVGIEKFDLDKDTKSVQIKYDRYSYFYDIIPQIIMEKTSKEWRKSLLSDLKGEILEIGVGTGKNLEYYHKDAIVTGVDLSAKMLEKARIKQGNLKNNIKLIQMDAQQLKFLNNSYDYVVCTFLLCSVPDPVKAIKEMDRICKKGGKILMIEHILSENILIAFFQHLHNPITKTLFGFNVNRKTIENINKAGLAISKEINLKFADVFKRIEIEK